MKYVSIESTGSPSIHKQWMNAQYVPIGSTNNQGACRNPIAVCGFTLWRRKPSALHGWLNHPACSIKAFELAESFYSKKTYRDFRYPQNKERMQSGTSVPLCIILDSELIFCCQPILFGMLILHLPNQLHHSNIFGSQHQGHFLPIL